VVVFGRRFSWICGNAAAGELPDDWVQGASKAKDRRRMALWLRIAELNRRPQILDFLQAP